MGSRSRKRETLASRAAPPPRPTHVPPLFFFSSPGDRPPLRRPHPLLLRHLPLQLRLHPQDPVRGQRPARRAGPDAGAGRPHVLSAVSLRERERERGRGWAGRGGRGRPGRSLLLTPLPFFSSLFVSLPFYPGRAKPIGVMQASFCRCCAGESGVGGGVGDENAARRDEGRERERRPRLRATSPAPGLFSRPRALLPLASRLFSRHRAIPFSFFLPPTDAGPGRA